MNPLIVGAGQIAREYCRICIDLGYSPRVVTRGTKKATALSAGFPSVDVVTGGLAAYLDENASPAAVILATPIETLPNLCEAVIKAGADAVLAEKPLVLSSDAVTELQRTIDANDTDVYAAFNRRHYTSAELAREIIEADGGVSSFWIDFTEATFRIEPDHYHDNVLRRWGIANSSHVLDMAFHLGGQPTHLTAEQEGDAISWHPTGSIFYGNGTTVDGTPFCYHSDWGSPGSWRIEINTPKHKLLFAPLERLQIQKSGSFALTEYEADYSIDEDYKPGFYKQTQRFLAGEVEYLPTIKELESEVQLLETLFGYKKSTDT